MSSELSDIRNRAIGFLARREHSAKELFHKLALRGYGTDSIKLVLEKLVREGLQSDDRFTEVFIHTRIQKGYGPMRIKQELREKGIGDALIEDYLEQPEEDWLKLAKEVREKKFGSALPDDINIKMKQSRFLQQRGFSGEQIRKIFRAGEGED